MAIEVESYLVRLDLTEAGEQFEATTTITFTAHRPQTRSSS